MPLSPRASLASAENTFTEEMRISIQQTIRDALQPLSQSIEHSSAEIYALKQQVAALEAKLAARDPRILQLDTANQKLHERIDAMEEAHDSLEQHGRRMNFRVQNIPFNEGETSETLQQQVLGLLQDAGAAIDPNDIERLHRSSALQVRDNVCGGRRCSQVIVRVVRWRAREAAHNARNTARTKGHPIRQDLTKLRRDLISSAQAAISDWGELRVPVWAYANINCQTVLRQGKEVRRFSTASELHDALAHFRPSG